ncbi:metallophosphoesterase family protein [Halopseudomonas salegens]|uniref:DNA repair exonuclease SbcCD nuclease subunit n=1 Tax=Halopseudomonas salegens TaxID=1434072 RepID=A0A1H2H3G2_9GAMM|nr:DNA repair exonuclease [Halopseudomonas salegens]SDU26417.1 DNA repair exonuclease SbcCD nuclease subunit [Halopseudomonas salegens]
MPSFLHTADWQIGRQYGRFASDDAVALAEARFSCVERIAALASEWQVDAVLVAGDVFDAQTVSDRIIRRLFNALQAYAGPWLLLPGNHDAALVESVWSRAVRLQAVPDNVHLLLRPEVHRFPAAGFAVLPAPLTQRQTNRDLTDWFDSADTPAALLRIGLAHGSVQGILAADIDSPNPIAAGRAEQARLDYLALGDWHGLKQVDARTWYSGTPEQERFKANGAGQVLKVEIPGPGAAVQVSAHEVGGYQWQQWQRDIQLASDIDQCIADLDALPDTSVLDLALRGTTDLSGLQRLQQALSVAAGRFRSLACHWGELTLAPSAEDLVSLQADGYLAEVVEQLQQRQAGPDAEVAREALMILATLMRDHAPAGSKTCN